MTYREWHDSEEYASPSDKMPRLYTEYWRHAYAGCPEDEYWDDDPPSVAVAYPGYKMYMADYGFWREANEAYWERWQLLAELKQDERTS
jgi:hypothetical protein